MPRDWGNLFVMSRVRYIENLDLTNFQENNQNIHYIEGTDGSEHNNVSFRSCIRGYHEYKDIWDVHVVVGEFLEDFKRNLILVCLCRIHLLSHVDIYSLYRGIFYIGLLDCVRYNEDFVISRFVV